MLRNSFLISLFLLSIYSQATHLIGGFINYTHLNGTSYEITIVKYDEPNSPGFRRRELVVNFGDGTADSVSVTSVFPPILDNVAKREYKTIHTYNRPGSYKIEVEDPNRPGGIDNIVNSANVPFYVSSILKVDPTNTIKNNSATILNDPIFNIQALGKGNIKVNAFDPDDDIIKYRIVSTKGINGLVAPSYQFIKNLSINSFTGVINYDSIPVGTYSLSIEISEYRNSILVGQFIYDVILFSNIYPNQNSFTFSGNYVDSCGIPTYILKVGDTLLHKVIASNQQNNDNLELIGEPLIISSQWNSNYNSNLKETTFMWVPDSTVLRCNPYFLTFRSSFYQGNQTKEDHTIQIRVIDSTLSCDSLCKPISVGLVRLNEQKKKSFIYPNPVKNQFQIKFPKGTRFPLYLECYNLNGELVKEKVIQSESDYVYRDGLKNGLYFYQIKDESKVLNYGKIIFL